MLLESEPGIITTPMFFGPPGLMLDLVLYSSIPVLDSSGNIGHSIEPDRPLNNVSSVQIFLCSQSLVNQKATVDSQSRQIISIEPEIKKNTSAWASTSGLTQFFQGSQHPLNISPPISFLDLWATWYDCSALAGGFAYSQDPGGSEDLAGPPDIYLIEQLNLLPPPGSIIPRPSNITLHDLENALSSYVALTFWTAGHIPPFPVYNTGGLYNGRNVSYPTKQVLLPPTLAKGQALVTRNVIKIRTDVSVGLAVSIALSLLSLQLLPRDSAEGEAQIGGTGILHSIWLYRNHPTLPELLKQVEHPSDENLRKAGMRNIFALPDPTSCEGLKSDSVVGPAEVIEAIDGRFSNYDAESERERDSRRESSRAGRGKRNTVTAETRYVEGSVADMTGSSEGCMDGWVKNGRPDGSDTAGGVGMKEGEVPAGAGGKRATRVAQWKGDTAAEAHQRSGGVDAKDYRGTQMRYRQPGSKRKWVVVEYKSRRVVVASEDETAAAAVGRNKKRGAAWEGRGEVVDRELVSEEGVVGGGGDVPNTEIGASTKRIMEGEKREHGGNTHLRFAYAAVLALFSPSFTPSVHRRNTGRWVNVRRREHLDVLGVVGGCQIYTRRSHAVSILGRMSSKDVRWSHGVVVEFQIHVRWSQTALVSCVEFKFKAWGLCELRAPVQVRARIWHPMAMRDETCGGVQMRLDSANGARLDTAEVAALLPSRRHSRLGESR
ncbi:hypothetical protein C8R45DRAFT_938692 [Mycena sanguinolenta]|nr:hypothetical protein C8R45DRAFT_938692 [Mycena sanguinolenta]